jgi:site-specific recombinase XerD
MSDPSRVRITGPLSPFAQAFATELARQGYRPNAAANQLQLIAHLSRWLAAKGMDVGNLSSAVLNEFLAARRAQRYTLWLSPKALMPFLDHMCDRGFALPPSQREISPTEELLARYRKYLFDVRGLADTSARGYVDMVRPFVMGRAVDGQLDWASLTPAGVTAFMRSASRRRSIGSAQLLSTALRSLLGYLHIEGLILRPLDAAVPSVAGSKLAGLPRGLEAAEVERLLAACDRRTRTGRRDFAMLMLLVRLGLRAGEVRTLSLDDLDWHAGELIVRGKGHRVERLPLPADVGEAVAAYLRRGRPATAQGRAVFVRVHAPHRPLTSGAVTNAVLMAASRAGLPAVTAHRLRHTIATQMVRAGVPLPEISQVLRHRRLLTTAIYAKVDRDNLRHLARRWPGGAP